MQTFHVMQKNYAILGIGQAQAKEKYLLNVRNFLTFFMLSGAASLSCVHLYYEAKTFKDYAEAIYTGSSLIVSAILFVFVVSDMRLLIKCFLNIEKLVNESKFQINQLIAFN